MNLGERVKALRTALGLSHQQVAARSGGLLRREYVVKIETGRNKLSSRDMRKGLARGLGLTDDELERFLEGALPVDDAARIAGVRVGVVAPARVAGGGGEGDAPAPTAAAAGAPGGPPSARVVERDALAPLERALLDAMAADARAFELADFDAVRAMFRETFQFMRPGVDLVAFARDCLVAARQLRRESLPPTSAAIAMRVAVGRAGADDGALNEAGDAAARAMGVEPGSASHVGARAAATIRRQKRRGDGEA